MTRSPFGDPSVGGDVPVSVSVTVRPAMLSRMVREVVWLFEETCSRTVPLPVPLEPLVIETQLTFGLSAAVQAQPLCAETEIVTAPPAAPMLGVIGDTV
jgi:hypothetical protein